MSCFCLYVLCVCLVSVICLSSVILGQKKIERNPTAVTVRRYRGDRETVRNGPKFHCAKVGELYASVQGLGALQVRSSRPASRFQLACDSDRQLRI